MIIPSRTLRIPLIENLREKAKGDQTKLNIIDFKNATQDSRTVSDIARKSLSHRRFSAFLLLLCRHLGLEMVFETGTSLGLNAAYMAVDQSRSVVTLEGNMDVAAYAMETFKQASQTNVTVIEKDLREGFVQVLKTYDPELIFLDADHSSGAIDFCISAVAEHSRNARVIAIHDIYWSRDMTQAWLAAVANPEFPLTVDLFQAGLVFLNVDTPKQHFTVKF